MAAPIYPGLRRFWAVSADFVSILNRFGLCTLVSSQNEAVLGDASAVWENVTG